MKKLNNKGFTLIELLSVIVIISLLMAIAVPAALSVSKKVKAKTYANKISLAEKSAALWATDNKSCLKAIATKSLPTDDGTNSISNIDGCNGVVNNCKISKDDTNVIECTTTMGTLAEIDYFKYDKKDKNQKMIIVDPRDNKSSLNETTIIIKFNKNGDSIKVSPIEITTIKKTQLEVNLCGCRSTYNGKEQICSEDLCAVKSTTNTELSKNYTITFSSTISGTNAGTYKRPYSGVTIKNGEKDVTNRYDISYKGGIFYIDKKEIQVTANSCSFIRNNLSQTCSGAFVNSGYSLLTSDTLNIEHCCKVAGTAVNSYVNPINGIAIKNNSTNGDNTGNYNISKKTDGTLTIKNPELKTITVSNDNYPFSYVNSTTTVSSVSEIVSVTASSGTINVSNISFSNNTISFTGTAEEYTVDGAPKTTSIPAESRDDVKKCTDYKCNSGGYPSGSTCVGNNEPVTNNTCYCLYKDNYLKLQCETQQTCSLHHSAEGTVMYEINTSSHGTLSNHNGQTLCQQLYDYGCRVSTGYMHVTGTCVWEGNYPATCASETSGCNSYEYPYYGKCYYCNNGTIDGTSCDITKPEQVTKYRYNYTISYYE